MRRGNKSNSSVERILDVPPRVKGVRESLNNRTK